MLVPLGIQQPLGKYWAMKAGREELQWKQKARGSPVSEEATQDLGWQQVPFIAPIAPVPFSFVSFAVLPTHTWHWRSSERTG